jgi:hypothetical protein
MMAIGGRDFDLGEESGHFSSGFGPTRPMEHGVLT